MIPRGPIVQQDKAEDVLLRVLDRHLLAPGHGFGDVVAHLELKVKASARAVDGLGVDAVFEGNILGSRDRAGSWDDGGDAGVVDRWRL